MDYVDLQPSSIDFEKIKKLSRRKQRSNRERGTVKRVDFVLVAKNEKNASHDRLRTTYFHNLRKKRLKLSDPIFSQDNKLKFWHVYAPFDVLCDVAEDLNVRLPTQENDIDIHMSHSELLVKFLTWWNSVDPFIVKDSCFQTPKSYFADIFDKGRLKEFHNENDPKSIFSETERSRLVAYLLESTPYEVGKSTRVGKTVLHHLGVFAAGYPCHDGPLANSHSCVKPNARQNLRNEWANFRYIFKYQPIQAIRDYFGVKVAFYYAWLGFYTSCLVPASIVGVLCCIYGAMLSISTEATHEICSSDNATLIYMCPLCDGVCSYYNLNENCRYAYVYTLLDNAATVVFSMFIALWSVLYLMFWKRQEKTLAYQWHTMDFQEEEVVRPQFLAAAKNVRSNPVTGKIEPCGSKKERWFKVTGGVSVVLFFITLVISTVIGVIVYRAAIFGILSSSAGKARKNSKIFVTVTAAVINLFVINILKVAYTRLALIMTTWENPRTRSSYEKSFTIKMFYFQFCNTYSSVFYVAFFKSELFVGWPGSYKRIGNVKFRLEGCSTHGCFLELSIQLIILMVGQKILGSITHLAIPYLHKKYNSWKHKIKQSTDVPIWEADYQLGSHDHLCLVWEYQEVALQYGFVTMFVAAFPLAPLIALITSLIEIRIDAINMIESFRRPIAFYSDGIGVWHEILISLTGFGFLVNGLLVAMTSEFIPRTLYRYKYSEDGTLNGFMNWSLSYFNVSDFTDIERPINPTLNIAVEQPFCRYFGFHVASSPYGYSIIHWELMAIRLAFALVFHFTVHLFTRLFGFIISETPRSITLKIKREEFLAQKALKKYKIISGKRKADNESSDCEEEDMEGSLQKRNNRIIKRYSSKHRNEANGTYTTCKIYNKTNENYSYQDRKTQRASTFELLADSIMLLTNEFNTSISDMQSEIVLPDGGDYDNGDNNRKVLLHEDDSMHSSQYLKQML